MPTDAAQPSRKMARKSVEALQRDAGSTGLKRTLGPWNLMLLGIGCILGAGIYVMTGTAAANFAGPAVMLSFVIAGVACGLTALCYAELASALPVSGSSYSYAYASIGEVFAWALGWLLMLEYGLAGSLLAVGFAGYFGSLLHDFGVVIPAVLASPTLQAVGHGSALIVHPGINLVAVGAVAAVSVILTLGVSESATVNNVLVLIKISVLVAFVAVGVGAVHPHNWTPFIPRNEGGFTYGWQGVVRAASILFFAYLGFETVSTAAAETRNPQKDMPFGILGALGACTIIYIIVAAVLTGVVPFRELGVADPIALAADRMGQPQMATLIKLGALMGLSSVLLVNCYGQSRIGFAMSRDGLLPQLFGRLHKRFRTPWQGILLLGAISAVMAAVFPISLLGDLVSLGTALAFMIVSICLMWLRSTRPDLERPFKVPFGGMQIGRVWIGLVPVAAILACVVMILPVGIDIVGQALAGHVVPAVFLGSYAVAGALVYVFYGRRRARTMGDPAIAAAEIISVGKAAS